MEGLTVGICPKSSVHFCLTYSDLRPLTSGIHMFEHRHERVAPLSVFIKRLAGSFGIICGLLFIALLIGISGYHWLAGLSWVDSILEASMILGGMGPVNPLTKTSAKLFASAYALFSGVVFIGLVGILLTPVVHRILHKFHVEKTNNG
jgi:hypothetical protein